MEKHNKDIKEVIKPTKGKTYSSSASAKGKKKHVAFAEQAKNIVVGSSELAVRVFKSKFKYVQQMKQIDKAPGRPPFSQWKEYHRCLEELEEIKGQLDQSIQATKSGA